LPYLLLLRRLLAAVTGSQAALLLDAQGEVVVEAGATDDRQRLIGAYQGIALSAATRTTSRYEIGTIDHLSCRYTWGTVILRPLKDGYYLVVSLGPQALLGRAIFHSALAQEGLNAEL
jgi:predicted regulator of Ras-like GTPase activity (Roadblock/LC7/MglB family)